MRTEDEMLTVVRAKADALLRRRRSIVLGVVSAIVVVTGMLVFVNRGSDAKHQRVNVADNSTSTNSSSATASTTTTVAQVASTADTPPMPTVTGATGIADLPSTESPPPASTDHAITSVTVSPVAPVTGEIVKVAITIKNRKVDDAVGLWRDQMYVGTWGGPPGWDAMNCASTDLQSDEESLVFDTAYKLPGQHVLTAVVWGCNANAEASVSIPIIIQVGGSMGPTNGPFAPYFVTAQQFDQTTITLDSVDGDGTIDRYLIDWGDGTPAQTVVANTTPGMRAEICDNSREYDTTESIDNPTHVYAVAGDYAVTITVVSVGCNGVQPHQQANASITMHIA